ncbi:hypothetical protein BH23ACT9_BH23ACT9_36960 [soil metagenome]
MKRTQMYITEEQDARLTQMSKDRGVPKAEVVRSILDAALGSGDAEGEADAAIRATAGVLADAQDWPQWLRAVRGRTADERLTEAG